MRSIRRLGKISAHEGSIYSFASHETGLYTAAADTLVKVRMPLLASMHVIPLSSCLRVGVGLVVTTKSTKNRKCNY